MNQNVNRLELIGQSTGELQKFVDNTMSLRYDKPQWKNFFVWGKKSFDKTFSVAEAEMDLMPMASVIDSNSPKPKRSIQGLATWNGSVPELGHGYDLTKDDLRDAYLMAQNGGNMDVIEIMKTFENTVNKLEFGVHSRINSMGFLAISTGHIVLDSANNPDGIPTDLDMRIPMANKLYAGYDNGVSQAWTEATATPIVDMTDAQQTARLAGIPSAVWYMHTLKWVQLINHPTVMAAVNARSGRESTSPVFEADVRAYLQLAGIYNIQIIDEMSGLQVDGATQNIESWEESNIVLAPSGILGEVKTAMPVDVGDPAVKVAYTEDGRIQILQSFDGIRKVQSFECECSALPVLTKAKQIIILDTSTTDPWN